MRHVLGFVGSPRKNGNTHLLVSRILEGARAEGAETGLVLLPDLSIEECDGCLVCWKGKPCPKQDDMNALYPRIVASDVVVFGTPVYWYGPTALMKAMIDRWVYFNCPENRAKIRGKLALLAIPYEDQSPETGRMVATFFEKCLAYVEMELAGQVVVGGVDKKGDILKKPESLNAAFDLGRSAVRSLSREA
jgi:multimeric flavodoxin WrbA